MSNGRENKDIGQMPEWEIRVRCQTLLDFVRRDGYLTLSDLYCILGQYADMERLIREESHENQECEN